ncbi:MAG: iron-containing alcohol dehydrogenase [Deltaproteobacteria bacterium]
MLCEMSFPTKIVLGPGALAELPARLSALGAKAPLVVTDPGVVAAGLYAKLQETLARGGIPHALFSEVHANPIEADCLRGLEAYRRAEADSLVALGGGSAMDAAKGIRLLTRHEPPLSRYDDTTGGERFVTEPLPPLVAIPTTAGTGSEVGRSAVITLAEGGRKAVLFSPRLIPSLALCDPELTRGLPVGPTAATGMDAFVHCFEAYCAKGIHPLADAIAIDGVGRASRALPKVVRDGQDLEARGEMMIAAIMGAVAFQKGLGACHSLAHALTPICGVHHGLANAIVLPHVARYNQGAIPGRFARIAVAMGERDLAPEAELAARAVDRIQALTREIGIPERLRDVGLREEQIPQVAHKAFQDGCHQLNPRPVTEPELEALCRAAY